MKNYVVALISFFDNEIFQFEIVAESKYEATKKAIIKWCSEESIQDELEHQKSEVYPKNFEDLKIYLGNCEMDISVLEVGSFVNN